VIKIKTKINEHYSYSVEVKPFVECGIKWMDIFVTLYKNYPRFDTYTNIGEFHERTWEPNFICKWFGDTDEKRTDVVLKKGIRKVIKLANLRKLNEEYAEVIKQKIQ
jgi:hypothetical protein